MNNFQWPPVILISGMPRTGKTTIARKILKSNSEYIVIEQVDVIREVLRCALDQTSKCFADKNPHKTYVEISRILHTSSYKLSDDDYLIQCKLLTPAIVAICNRLYQKGIPIIVEGVNIDIKTIISSEDVTFIAKSNEIIFINLFRNDKKYKNDLSKKVVDCNDTPPLLVVEKMLKRSTWLYERLNHVIKDENAKNVFNVDLSNNTVFPHSTDLINHLILLYNTSWQDLNRF